MKKLRNVILSVICCLCILLIPGYGVQAASGEIGSVSNVKAKQSYTVDHKVKMECEGLLTVKYNDGQIGTMRVKFTGVANDPGSAYSAALDHLNIQKNEITKKQQHYKTSTGYEYWVVDCGGKIEKTDPPDVEDVLVSKGSKTRHYGYAVYTGTVNVALVNREITRDQVENALRSGGASKSLVGFGRRGGGDDTRTMNGADDQYADLGSKIVNFPHETNTKAFFDAFGTHTKPRTYEEWQKMLHDATESVNVPYIAATLVMSTGTSCGYADLIGKGLNPWTTDYKDGLDFFRGFEGGDTLVTALTGDSAGNIGFGTDKPLFSAYAYPWDGDPITLDTTYVFGVKASPRKVDTNWKNDRSTRAGTVTVTVMSGDQEGILPNQYYNIEVNAEISSGQYPGAHLSSVDPLGSKSEMVKGSNLYRSKSYSFTYDITGDGPSNSADGVENLGEVHVTVKVTSPTGEVTDAIFTSSLSDSFAKGSGVNGYNYVSWIGHDIPEGDLELVPWALHSSSDPNVEGTLGASEYNNEDWDIGVGIPSTENVYLNAGGESAISDLAGYFVIRSDTYYDAITQGSDGENENGIGDGNPSVTRVINVEGTVKDTWGYNNTLCALTPTQWTVDGGDKNDDTGGGSPRTCPNYSEHTGGKHGSGKHCTGDHNKGHQNSIAAYKCSIHGTQWTSGSGQTYDCSDGHGECGVCTNEDDEGCHTCKAATIGDCNPKSMYHDCTWKLTVRDGSTSINPAGTTSSNARYLPDKIEINIPNWTTLSINTFYNNSTWVQGKATGSKNSWINLLVDCSKGQDSTAVVKGKLVFERVDNQYFHIQENTIQVGQNLEALHKKGIRSSGNAHWSNTVEDKTEGNTATKEGPFSLNASNGSDKLCEGYTYGTGSSHTTYDNCVHRHDHTYTLRYRERIDFYAFRAITDAHLAALQGTTIAELNKVTKTGYPEGDGTYSAPIDDSAKNESVTAPIGIGYLFRCINNEYGSYINGPTEGDVTSEDGGTYNGRILFELWKNINPPVSGDGLIYKINSNYSLGNVTVKCELEQDHIFANDSSIYDQQLSPTSMITSLPASRSEAGKNDNRYHHNYVTSLEKDKGETAREYYDHGGDCITNDWNYDANYIAKDETAACKNYIICEQNAIINYFQSINRDDNYHANIISDNMCYGDAATVTQITGEYYTVEQNGVPLFNWIAGNVSHGIDDKSVEIYRNHHSDVGTGRDELANFIYYYKVPESPSMSEGEHFWSFGYNGTGVTGVSLGVSFTGRCVGEKIYTITNGSKGDTTVPEVYGRNLGSGVGYVSGEAYSGVTKFESYTDSEGGAGDSFTGYWREHQYPAHVSETITGKCNVSEGYGMDMQDMPGFMFTGTNSGTLNNDIYGTHMLIHNLPLVDWTPNGNWPTLKLHNEYGWLLNINSKGCAKAVDKLNENGVYGTHQTIVSGGISKDLDETIYIYDPISAENSYNIGNQYGNFSGNPITPDESGYDQRVSSIGKAKNDFDTIGNYVCTNTYLWTWIAPFGNFASVGGSGGVGADITTGEINDGCIGYRDDMYIGTWTKDVKIHYPFIAKSTSKNMVYDEFSISDLTAAYGYGNSNYMEAQYGPDSLQKFYKDRPNPVFKFGNAVGALNTVDLHEGRDKLVVVTAYAINDGIKVDDHSCYYGESVNPSGANTDKLHNAASKEIQIDLVGQIGNLAIHDTTDFRFSTFFKKANDTWLIDGIVKNIDEKEPVHILAAPKDILFQDANAKDYKHSTLGITDMLAPSGSKNGKGMSGPFSLLPLTPAYITVDEFKTDALRLGYKVYASIETIGNYHGIHMKGQVYPTNFDQAADGKYDNREQYLEIISEYYLYDFDDGKFYAIDLWSGPEGAKQCIYSGSDRKVHAQQNSEPLYINLDEESDRRNVSVLERAVSDANCNIEKADKNGIIYTALHSGLEFIGYTGHIKLDTMDLTYCGSDAVQGIEGYNTCSDIYTGATNTSQRWHFTSGLTSTTVPTIPIYKSGTKLNATQVENAYRGLHDKHPNSVIVEFQNYMAKGEVWALKYKGSLMNTDEIKFYSNNDDCPYKIKDHIKTKYKGYDIYNPETGAKYGSQIIDPDSTPFVAYEAYKSNSEDRTVAGTH